MAKEKPKIEDQFEKAGNRLICRKCAAQYRYEIDAEEHLALGCKVKPGKKKQHSFTAEPDAPSAQ